MKTVLSTAIVDVQALVGLSADVVLASVDGTVVVTVDVLAKLVGDLLIVSTLCRRPLPPLTIAVVHLCLAQRLLDGLRVRFAQRCIGPPLLARVSISLLGIDVHTEHLHSEVVGALVSVILSVTAHLLVGLDVAILGCIGSILSVIVHLNISIFLAILPIKL